MNCEDLAMSALFFLQVTPPLDKITKPFYMSAKISLKVEGSKIKNLDMKKKILLL